MLCTNCLLCGFPVNVNVITCGFLELVLTFVSSSILTKDLERLLLIVFWFSLCLTSGGLIKNNSTAQEKKPFSIDSYS